MTAVERLLAEVEAEHGPEIAEVVRRYLAGGSPPPRRSRRLYGGNRDPNRTGHALGGFAGGTGHGSRGTNTSPSVRESSSSGR